MADLYVKKFDMINPFVVASSPATQGALNVLKSAKMRPGAIVLRNYGHGSGGGSFIGPDSKAMLAERWPSTACCGPSNPRQCRHAGKIL